MSMGGRASARQQMLKRAGLIAGVLVLIALLLIVTGHWILGIIFGAAAVLAVALFRALRSVR